MRLVDAFLLGLDFGAQVVQALVGLGDVGDQRGHAVGGRIALRETGTCTPAAPRSGPTAWTGRTSRATGRTKSPGGCVSFDSGLLRLNADGRRQPHISRKAPIDNTSIIRTVRHRRRLGNAVTNRTLDVRLM